MEKLDLSKKYKTYFSAKAKPEIVHIEKASFLSICGKGDPSGYDFAERIAALYPAAYALKFASKANGKDFVVSKLEGLWWFDEKKFAHKTITTASTEVPRSEWEYRLLIRLPDFITKEEVDKAKEKVLAKKNIPLTAALEFFTLEEGTCVHMLHVGPYSTEPETLRQMGDFMESHRLARNGLYHEVYLSDFRKTAPEKLRTILREPVQ